MQTAILFFIASSVGVSVGWQPMPDGSPRYEYVVQLDRELLAILKQGESIPISSEVPDDIRPIARIRIVVGDENLPRQKLVAQFKPWPEGRLRESQSREGLVETQYVVPSDAANLNVGNNAPRYENQPILPADSSSQQILPPSKEILPPQNNGRYVEPIQNANQKRGNQWRDTSASSQADIQQLFGENSRGNLQPVDQRSIVIGNRYDSSPSGSGPISPRPQSILPPTAGPRYPRLDEPMMADHSSDRNQSPPSELSPNGSPVAGTSGVIKAPWPAPERFEDAPLAQAWNTQNRTEDRPASQTTDDSHSPEWPKTETPDRTASDSQWPNSPPPTPEIRREMLDGPASAELQTASGGPVSPTPASFPQLAAQAPAPLPPRSTVISQPQTAGPTGGSPSGSVFPLLLAWVLLSGSGAGNLYLFWSYLDIRNKYRGLIRTAGRKLGRHDAEEEYEDYDE
ncbi:MAG: hypothetical protein IH831_08745 [Planctomycetes bacterium]|nr:hypothetical protein [Planctomycetota bacterium]